MISAELDRQLMIRIDNQLGTLADITGILGEANINLVALCAYTFEKTCVLMFVTDDNNAAKKLLESHEFEIREDEVILLKIGNKPGSLKEVSESFAKEGIDMRLSYGSVDKDADQCQMVLITDNNLDAMMIIKTQLERS